MSRIGENAPGRLTNCGSAVIDVHTHKPPHARAALGWEHPLALSLEFLTNGTNNSIELDTVAELQLAQP